MNELCSVEDEVFTHNSAAEALLTGGEAEDGELVCSMMSWQLSGAHRASAGSSSDGPPISPSFSVCHYLLITLLICSSRCLSLLSSSLLLLPIPLLTSYSCPCSPPPSLCCCAHFVLLTPCSLFLPLLFSLPRSLALAGKIGRAHV